MSNIRPADATHTDSVGNYYKPDEWEELHWMRWAGPRKWTAVGTVPAGTLTALPPVQVVKLEKFDTPMAPRAVHTDAPMPSLTEIYVPPAPQLHPSLPDSFEDTVPYTAHIMEYRFVGSRVTCSPPPLNTDQDVLLLIWPSDLQTFERKVLEDGFVQEGSNPAELGASIDKESVFHSYRKGDMNYIVTTDEAFYQRFSTATELSRKYNLMEKSDRIQLFQAVLYGKWWA